VVWGGRYIPVSFWSLYEVLSGVMNHSADITICRMFYFGGSLCLILFVSSRSNETVDSMNAVPGVESVRVGDRLIICRDDYSRI